MLERGEAILLLDGLDAVAGSDQRQAVLRVLEAALLTWRHCGVVVASRPSSTEPLVPLGFRRVGVAPLDLWDIGAFVSRWLALRYGPAATEPGALPAEAADYRNALELTFASRPELRRLAANPLTLTCLCVAHWNEGRLPEGRARVYQALMDWLLTARAETREALGFPSPFAERALSALALDLKGAAGATPHALGPPSLRCYRARHGPGHLGDPARPARRRLHRPG